MKRLYVVRRLVALLAFACSLVVTNLGFITAHATTASPLWSQQYSFDSTSRVNRGIKMAQDANGNVYVVSNVLESSGYNHVGIVKYDSSGNILWTQSYAEANQQTV
jgi:hypothetical protein